MRQIFSKKTLAKFGKIGYSEATKTFKATKNLMRESPMVSMKDIAQHCGVSVATVSKALNGQRDIGEDTRARICAVAEELGYMTNSVARA